MSDLIDISGLDKAAVLAALFNASAPQGLGFLQSGRGPQTMTTAVAKGFIDQQGNLHFDYVLGRPLKCNLDGDEFDPWGYDRDNGGEGTAKKVIDRLRETSEVDSTESQEHHAALLIEKADQAMTMANTPTERIVHPNGISEVALGASDLGDLVEHAVDQELARKG